MNNNGKKRLFFVWFPFLEWGVGGRRFWKCFFFVTMRWAISSKRMGCKEQGNGTMICSSQYRIKEVGEILPRSLRQIADLDLENF